MKLPTQFVRNILKITPLLLNTSYDFFSTITNNKTKHTFVTNQINSRTIATNKKIKQI